MRLVIWSTAFPPSLGGVERFSEELAAWLSHRGHEVIVLTGTPSDGVQADPDYRVIRGAGRTRAIQEMGRADAVQVAGLSLGGIALARAAGRRPIVTHQGPHAVCPAGLAWSDVGECDAGPRPGPCDTCPTGGLRGWSDVRAHRAAVRRSAGNVFVSEFLKRLVALPGPVIYNPLPASLFHASSRDPHVALIVAAGRLVREKGFDLLVRAMRGVDAELVIAGDGPVRSDLEGLVEEADVRQKVRFVGRRSLQELVTLYAQATLTCVPTRMGEPFGYAVAEAMALGVPVVGTPTGAIPELLAGDRGYVAQASTPGSLAATIREALADDEGRVRRAAAARAFAREQLHVDVIGRRYEELYAS